LFPKTNRMFHRTLPLINRLFHRPTETVNRFEGVLEGRDILPKGESVFQPGIQITFLAGLR
jgi:hypothetical protein